MEHRLELGKFHVRNLLPNSIYKVRTEILRDVDSIANVIRNKLYAIEELS